MTTVAGTATGPGLGLGLGLQVATIATRPSWPALRVLRDTLAEHHPDAHLHVLDLDGVVTPGSWREDGALPATVVRAEDLDVAPADVHRRALAAGRTALVAWLRPLLLAHVLTRHEAVVHLEPGWRVLGPLDALLASAGPRGAAALGRTHRPPADDAMLPGAADLLAAGRLDPGALAVTRAGRDLLRWWADAETTGDGGSPWLSVLPGVTAVDPDDGLTVVGPWTVDRATRLEDVDGRLHRDGRPTTLVDLRGVDPDLPWLLDARLPDRPRALLSEHPALAAVVAGHARALAAGRASADDDGDNGDAPLAYTTLHGGVPVTATVRAAFRAGVADWRAGSAPEPPDPFAAGSAEAFVGWLTEPATTPATMPTTAGAGTVSRYLTALRAARPDLLDAFAEVPGADAARLERWAARFAAGEGHPPELVRPANRATDAGPGRAPRTRRRGVNVVGYLRGELGVGESARLVLDALDAAGVPHATTAVSVHLQSRQEAGYTRRDDGGARFATTLLCVNADMTAPVRQEVPDLVRAGRTIGMWYWEVEEFPPALHGAFGLVDEVWAPTDFVRAAIEPHSPVPVVTVPPPLPVPRPRAGATRADLGLPEGLVFLFAFDYLSTVERKNPLGLLDAFGRAFPPGSGATLVIKTINGDRRAVDAERLRLAAAGRPDVVLLEDYLSAEDRDALVALCDCYVSLHRSEGLGLTMAEAMALAKPVIATGYGGNLQFMTPQNSYLVPYTLVPIPSGAEPYPAGARWADPDLAAAARAMRAVADDPHGAAERGRRGAADVAREHSAAAAGARMRDRLDAVETLAERAALARRHGARRLAPLAGTARRAVGRLRGA